MTRRILKEYTVLESNNATITHTRSFLFEQLTQYKKRSASHKEKSRECYIIAFLYYIGKLQLKQP